jgi:hypothetical protein
VQPFLADTCVLIDLDHVDLGGYASGIPLVSAVSVGELAFGIGVGDAEERAAREQFVRDVVVDHEILPYGVEEAKLYGVLATLVRASGRRPRPRRLDLQIAATAAAAGIPLLTTNPGDFVGADRLVEVVAVARPA